MAINIGRFFFEFDESDQTAYSETIVFERSRLEVSDRVS